MCELVVAAYDSPRPFADLADVAAGLERYGEAGFGWGVAWLDDRAKRVEARRGLGRFTDEAHGDGSLLAVRSRRFLVHLRRPTRLSTIQMADTQPFLDEGRSAWCHNGYLERAEAHRAEYDDVLEGRADSEIGWRYFLERVAATTVEAALEEVDIRFGGRVNLAYLDADGLLSVYSRNDTNRMWRYRLEEGSLASTDLHSDDNSLFDLVVPGASDRTRIWAGESWRLGEPVAATESAELAG